MLVWSSSTSPAVLLVAEEPEQAETQKPDESFTTSTPLFIDMQGWLSAVRRRGGLFTTLKLTPTFRG